MNRTDNDRVTLPPARTGRHRSNNALDPDDLVRVEVRMPASTAARLYERAKNIRRPVSHTATELINLGLDASGGDRPA